MENALYYTLSTIAQALAGLLGVMVAFIVLGLQRLDVLIADGRSLLRGQVGQGHFETCWRALLDGRIQGLREAVSARGGRVTSPEDATYEIAADAWHLRERVARKIQWTVALTLAEIALCFGLLEVTPAIRAYPMGAKLVLLGAFIPAVGCLLLYFDLIMTVVQGRPDSNSL